MKKKLKVAILALTDCEGCIIEIFNLGDRFLNLLSKIELADFKLFEDSPEPPEYDIAIVEGCPITKRDFRRLKETRRKSKILVALGACACLGGIAKIKNYSDKKKIIDYVYKKPQGIDNPDVRALKEHVKVDFEIPGCPINKEEFIRIMEEYIEGKTPTIPKRPVCFECPLKNNGCLLNKGKICFGPVTLAGCAAPCPQSGFFCDGCRGPLKEKIGLDILKIRLRENFNEKEALSILERFGGKEYFIK
ncbi:MAG TPA: NADH:ubiquinone oxidoreductase [Candidatus Nealsonbacteria bacterium]|uniref:NADH:ubiquinone oxidoreductase-like 20kDa subunit domain-containing protein n=1 Tax=marine sediment metagenome TaxID=412755 RepID=A0A0F9UJV3_9ZZZZ|nr:NADH:ubiquinone oxidoreductase [Candidatus Nealsonbacteria bacterium]HEB46150.1 NADH:ubiquinone oxidoreductase [Candidatus Nealsonbacteria bacterium]